jgi:hypothetical protein
VPTRLFTSLDPKLEIQISVNNFCVGKNNLRLKLFTHKALEECEKCKLVKVCKWSTTSTFDHACRNHNIYCYPCGESLFFSVIRLTKIFFKRGPQANHNKCSTFFQNLRFMHEHFPLKALLIFPSTCLNFVSYLAY